MCPKDSLVTLKDWLLLFLSSDAFVCLGKILRKLQSSFQVHTHFPSFLTTDTTPVMVWHFLKKECDKQASVSGNWSKCWCDTFPFLLHRKSRSILSSRLSLTLRLFSRNSTCIRWKAIISFGKSKPGILCRLENTELNDCQYILKKGEEHGLFRNLHTDLRAAEDRTRPWVSQYPVEKKTVHYYIVSG